MTGPAAHPAVDFTDIQGLVRFGFGKMTEASYRLVKIRDAGAARMWLAQAPVTTAVEMTPPPRSALQVALTREGLNALGLAPEILAGFSAEFLTGMAGDDNRSRRLGDQGANGPDRWIWGAGGGIPHLVVMLLAEPGLLPEWTKTACGELWDTAFEEIGCLSTSNLGGREQFGFIDGISQPVLDWKLSRSVSVNGNQLDYGNVVCLGEFLLGYPNEYRRYTDRPLVDPGSPAAAILPHADDQPNKKDLGRNGTYLVMRQLRQDVRLFWHYLQDAASTLDLSATRLAEAFVGRTLVDGAPLVPLSPGTIAGVGDTGSETKRGQDSALNRFTYELDEDGTRCPFGAHIRRANPRTTDLPGHPRGLLQQGLHLLGFGSSDLRSDLTASVRFHRLLRRGREYGPALSPQEALQPGSADEPERGLHFIALCANIERQFEFVQNAWIAQIKFDGMTEESDPLLGNREPVPGCPFTDSFSMARSNGARKRLLRVPRFITVRGGAYFFLPGIRALRYLSRNGSN